MQQQGLAAWCDGVGAGQLCMCCLVCPLPWPCGGAREFYTARSDLNSNMGMAQGGGVLSTVEIGFVWRNRSVERASLGSESDRGWGAAPVLLLSKNVYFL